MATTNKRIMTAPVQFKRFTTDAILEYIAEEGEPIIDLRSDTPVLRMGDGVTPGGIIQTLVRALGGVRKPVITGPVSGSVGIITTPLITASNYSAISQDGGSDPHAASRWIFATDAAMTSIVYDSGRDTAALVEYDFQLNGVTLPSQTKIYATVEYESEGGLTNTSDVITFTTV